MTPTPRLPYRQLAPKAFQQLFALSATLQQGPLGARLVDLVWLRVSQVNGCAFCMDMHWADLVREGADPRHLNTLAGWRESPHFTPRERAALQWAEALAAVSHEATRDEVCAQARAVLSEGDLAELAFAGATIRRGTSSAWPSVSRCRRPAGPPERRPGIRAAADRTGDGARSSSGPEWPG